jgi:hypothetical protein
MFSMALLLGAFFHLATTTTIQSHVCQLPNAPVILQPVDGTVTVEPHITVAILDNSVSVASVTSDSLGNFEVSVPLVEHQNQLFAQASNPCHETADSGSITVTYNKPPAPPTPPTPNPSQPSSPSTPASNTQNSKGDTAISNGLIGNGNIANNGATVLPSQTATSGPLTLYVQLPRRLTTSEPSIIVAGATNIPGTITIWVNGQRVAFVKTDENGRFRIRVPLTIGENELTISATAQSHTATLHVNATHIAINQSPDFWQRYGKLIIVILLAISACLILVKINLKRRSQ